MIKDILVHLDGTAQDEERLKHAEAVAAASQAHVTGLFTNALPDMPMIAPMDGGAAAAEVLLSITDEAKGAGDVLQGKLAERVSRFSVPAEIRRIDGTPGQLANDAVTEARWADLFVLGSPYRDDDSARWDNLFEAVLFESGRGVLVVPPKGRPADAIRRILVCWRNTREAARALAEAAPFLEKATRAVILAVDPERAKDGSDAEPAADIAKHVSRYGHTVEVNIIESQGRDVSEIILEQARRISADLIVMGGYGHSRTREWIIGGATRDTLRSSDIPVLIAH